MPTFIVKPSREEDFYVAWSTVVDAPISWGNRAEAAIEYAEERIQRADVYGTSMCDPAIPRDRQWFGWDDETFIVMEVGIPNRRNGSYRVSRGNVRALCERLEAEGDPTDLLTYEPWDDDEDTPPEGASL